MLIHMKYLKHFLVSKAQHVTFDQSYQPSRKNDRGLTSYNARSGAANAVDFDVPVRFADMILPGDSAISKSINRP